MDAEEADDAEITEHTVERAGAVLACHGGRVGVILDGGELGGDF